MGKEEAVDQDTPGLCQQDDGDEALGGHPCEAGEVAQEVVWGQGQQDGQGQHQGVALFRLHPGHTVVILLRRDHLPYQTHPKAPG